MAGLITMDDLTNDEILQILDDAERLLPVAQGKLYLPLLRGRILGNLFFEPSTRTRMSFETAMKFDTIQMVDGYTDVIAMRHPRQGAAQYAQDAASVPILNGGDGAGHHPTQTMLDLFTIKQAHGKLDGLKVVLAGDLRYGRTVHSLSHALVRFGCELIFASPDLLKMPAEIVSDLKGHGAQVVETEDLYGSMEGADVVYMTRIQKERFADEDEYARCAGAYKLHARHLTDVKQEMIVMHPLPRVDEIDPSVDATRHARYFEQAFNGVVARMALLCRLLGVKVPEDVQSEGGVL